LFSNTHWLAAIAEQNHLLVPQIDALRVADARGRVLNADGTPSL
jgi:hypothetical protein